MPDLAKVLGAFRRPKMEPMEKPEAEAEEGDDMNPMENPEDQSGDGQIMYLPKEMFKSNCKVGEEVVIKGVVEALGSKIGVQPTEVLKYGADEGEEQGGSDGSQAKY